MSTLLARLQGMGPWLLQVSSGDCLGERAEPNFQAAMQVIREKVAEQRRLIEETSL